MSRRYPFRAGVIYLVAACRGDEIDDTSAKFDMLMAQLLRGATDVVMNYSYFEPRSEASASNKARSSRTVQIHGTNVTIKVDILMNQNHDVLYLASMASHIVGDSAAGSIVYAFAPTPDPMHPDVQTATPSGATSPQFEGHNRYSEPAPGMYL